MKNMSRGFTLIEMVAVLAISTAIIAMSFPNIVNRNNNRLAEANIDEINKIIDAAQNYQFQLLQWPDEGNNCANAIAILNGGGYMGNIDATNPFGNNYQFTCTPQRLSIINTAENNDWALTVAGAIPATTTAAAITTTIIPRAGAIPAIVNKLDRDGSGGGMTANLDMNNNSIVSINNVQTNTVQATNVQTTQINGTNVSNLGAPANQVTFFAQNTCPSGWIYYAGAAGRTLVGAGVSDSVYSFGSAGGQSRVALTVAQLPAHSHDIYHGAFGGSINSIPTNAADNANGTLSRLKRTTSTGSNQSHENRMPFRVLTPCIKS